MSVTLDDLAAILVSPVQRFRMRPFVDQVDQRLNVAVRRGLNPCRALPCHPGKISGDADEANSQIKDLGPLSACAFKRSLRATNLDGPHHQSSDRLATFDDR